MNLPKTSTFLSRFRRRPGRRVLAVILAAVGCLSVAGISAQALAGSDHRPDLGPTVRVGTSTVAPPASGAPGQHARADNEDTDEPGEDHGDARNHDRDTDHHDDTLPVTPSTLPAAGDHDDADHDSDHSRRQAGDTVDHDDAGDHDAVESED